VTIRYMLDTNTVSYIVNGNSPGARRRLSNLHVDESACISSITAAEIHFGLARKPPTPAFQAAMDGFLVKIPILPWDRNEAQIYGKLRAKQEALGKPIHSMDMLIAAHAIAVGAVLVTRDGAFRQVDELGATENWATDL
jgi:tRNA(fMet)-specific endonuclease VapC